MRTWPRTPWLGKAEDDELVRLPALLADLRGLPAGSEARRTWYGTMAWVKTCSLGSGCSDEAGRAARGRRGDAQPSARSGDESDGAGRKTAADYVRERDARELRRKILQNCL